MHSHLLFARERLNVRLREEGFRPQDVPSTSSAYAMGFLSIIILSWPSKKRVAIKREVATIRTWTQRIGKAYGLIGQCEGPTLAAGGTYVVYCGFETEFLREAERIARERRLPVWQACVEDSSLIALARHATSPQFR